MEKPAQMHDDPTVDLLLFPDRIHLGVGLHQVDRKTLAAKAVGSPLPASGESRVVQPDDGDGAAGHWRG